MADTADMCVMESKITSKAVQKREGERERERDRIQEKKRKKERKKAVAINYFIYIVHTFSNRKGHSNNSISSWNTIQTTYEI